MAIARVLCILGVVYVHAWTGLTGPELAAADHTSQGLLRWVLSDLFGKAAVPLLSMVSGYLAAGSLGRRDGWSFVRGKARTVLLPMVLWNALAVLLVSGAARAGWIAAPVGTSASWLINELLCLTGPADINVQAPFLRDLFVCLALAPLIERLSLPGVAVCLLLGLLLALGGGAAPLLLRPAILFFFIIGLAARRLNGPVRLARLPILWLAGPYLTLALAHVALTLWPAFAPAFVQSCTDLAMRLAAALFFWSLAWRLAGGPAAASLLRLEPYMFLLFCAHLIMLWLIGPLLGQLTGPLGSPLYPVYLLAQPLLALGASIGLGQALARWSPQIAVVLSGGRLARNLEADSRRRPERTRSGKENGPETPLVSRSQREARRETVGERTRYALATYRPHGAWRETPDAFEAWRKPEETE